MRPSSWPAASAPPTRRRSSTACSTSSARSLPPRIPLRLVMVFRAIWTKIKQGLSKTRSLFGGIGQLLRLRGRVDQQFLNELEKRLYLADVGSQATTAIVDNVKQAFLDKEITGDVETFVKKQLQELLSGPADGIRYA